MNHRLPFSYLWFNGRNRSGKNSLFAKVLANFGACQQGEYQPIADDIYIQAVRAGRFNVHWHDGQVWQQLISISEQEAQALVAPMQFIGESKSKRQYYRPAIADVIERIEEASGRVF